jgi:hypothetical protein
MAVEQMTGDVLATTLAEVLQVWPLYRKLEYTGAEKVVAVPK